MKRTITFLCGLLISIMSVAQNFESCDRWAGTSFGNYEIWNNGWGGSFNEQCIWANNYDDWGTWSNQPSSSGGIKSYPHVRQEVNYNVDNMPNITSTFSVNVPGGGSYNTAYDIWYDNYAYEIMLWVNWNGEMGPIAYNYGCGGYPSTACPSATNVSVGGHTWNVYQGTNGSNIVYSFLRTSDTNSGTVNITEISQWLRNNGWFGNANLHDIQLGWEITQANSLNFSMNDFDVNIGGSGGGGGGGCDPSSISPYVQVDGGSWSQNTNVTVVSGGSVKFGPQPFDGSWSWSGCGTSGSSREQTIYPTSSCSATAIFTNSCGALSSVTYNIAVSGGGGGGSSNVYRLQNRGTGLYLDGYGRSGNGDDCAQYANTTHPNAQWEFVDAGSGYTQLRNVGTGLYLDGMGRTDNGSDVGQWANTNHYNSHWAVQQFDGSYYRLQNRGTGLYLDGMGRTSNGSVCGQWSNTTHPNAQWSLAPMSGAKTIGSQGELSKDLLEEMEVYPNPTSDFLKLNLSEFTGEESIRIVSITGQEVLRADIRYQSQQVDVRQLMPGQYILQIRSKSKTYTQKFVKI